MTAKLLLLALCALIVALFVLRVIHALARRREDDGRWPFAEQKPLTRVEQVLYYRLVQTLPEHVVLAQVPLSRFLRVRKGRTWMEWHNRISQKSIDYLVCERDFSIVAAIELDDKSHDSANRSVADATKARALAAAQVPLVRWRATALPDVETIRAVIDDIRGERSGRVAAVTVARVEPGLTASHIDASNDPTMFAAPTRRLQGRNVERANEAPAPAPGRDVADR